MVQARRGGPRLGWLVVPAGLLAWVSASGFQLWDAMELSGAAWSLSGSHPPGQPLHALLGHLFALVPLGPIEYRVALLSVVTEVGAAGLAACITAWLLRGVVLDEGASRAGRWLVRLAPHAAALACLLSPTFLREATRPEVYGLALFCALASVYALLRWLDGAPGQLRVAALFAGLAAATHPPEALAPLVFGALAALALRRDALRWRPLAWAALACLLGLAVFAYLPVRAAAGAQTWGEPTTLHGFVEYVRGAVFRDVDLTTRLPAMERLLDGLRRVVLGAGVVPLVGVVLALLWARDAHAAGTPEATRRKRSKRAQPAKVASARGPRYTHAAAAWMLAATSLGLSAAMWLLPLPSAINMADQPGYFAPQVAMLVAVGAAGLASLSARPLGVRSVLGDAPPLWQVALAAVALALLAVNPPNVAAARMHTTAGTLPIDTLGVAQMASPPPRSLVVVQSGSMFLTALGAGAIEGARPDVAFFGTGLATAPWVWRRLASHPLFDGRLYLASALRGASVRDQAVAAAVSKARGKVPIAYDRSPLAPRGAPVDGLYILEWPRGQTPSPGPSFGERLIPYIAETARTYPLGDADAGGAHLRQTLLTRAQDFLDRGDFQGASRAFRDALWFLPPELLARADIPGPAVRPMTKIVLKKEPTAAGTSRGDTIRILSVLLDATGKHDAAVALLKHQIAEGDQASQEQLDALEARDAAPSP